MDITPPPPPEPAKPKHKTPAEKRADERRKAVQQRYRWK
jgi:hypothetical protein